MDTLIKVSDALNRFVSAIGKLSSWLAIPLMLVIIFDVVSRRFFVLGSTKLQELEWHLHAVLFLMCFAFAYVKDSHVRIELLRDRFSGRTKAWIEIFGMLFFLIPYCVIILYFGYDFVVRSYLSHEVSSALTGLTHRWIIKAFVPLGFGLLTLAAISSILRNFVYLFGPERLHGPASLHLYSTSEMEMPDKPPATS
jgi:TRAP-type mannitol/chloroaromatic compound transport system permease small subunit